MVSTQRVAWRVGGSEMQSICQASPCLYVGIYVPYLHTQLVSSGSNTSPHHPQRAFAPIHDQFNFLWSEKTFLPDDFSNIDVFELEALILGIPVLTGAVKTYRAALWCLLLQWGTAGGGGGSPPWSPLYAMVLGLLVSYPDLSLGQLCMGSNLDRSHLHLSGNGLLCQHTRNWLGTCLPLTESIFEIQELSAYLDERDTTYKPVKDALKCYLKQEVLAESRDYNADWTPAVSTCSLHQIVKLYVGSNWYETYLHTLLNYSELLSNDKKVCWITYGQSLLIHRDGLLFQHVVKFLRLGKSFLPAEFNITLQNFSSQLGKENSCSFATLVLCTSDSRELLPFPRSLKSSESRSELYFPHRRLNIVSRNGERKFSKDPKEIRFGFQNLLP
ncbi:LOW QUALITY PROTEIN: BTB/POZ domain-containing protein KCTD19 [Podargus strigoides]